MSKEILDIYIPSYKKNKRTYRLVKSILKSDSDKFKIIVLDDCSGDGTYEMISEISDDRLEVHCNQNNCGAISTWRNAIELCQGKWIMHLNDRDEINVHILSDYIEYLDGLDEKVAVCFPNNSKRKNFTGKEVYYEFAYYECHPTGITVKRSALNEVDNWSSFFSYDRYGMYPHGYIFAILAKNWDFVTCDYYLWRESSATFKSTSNFWSGGTTNVKAKGKIYNDVECVKHNFSKNLEHLYLFGNDTFAVVKHLYFRNLMRVTYDYANSISQPDRANHYGLKPHRPDKKELLSIKKQFFNFSKNLILKQYDKKDVFALMLGDIIWYRIFIKREM